MQTTENPVSAPSGYDAKMQRAESLVAEFNKSLPNLAIPEGELTNHLKNQGAINEAALAFVTEDDLKAIPSIPAILARQIVASFKEKTSTEEKPNHVSAKQADRMRFEQLLGNYNPDNQDAVSRKLGDLSKGQPFIVFLPEGGVDVVTSTNLLKEIRAGFNARPNGTIEVKGTYHKIYKIGENPDVEFEENPIYPGRPLRPDGTCDQLNRSWGGVEKKVRQFLWIGVHETREIPITIDKAHDLLDKILQGDSRDRLLNLQRRFQKTALRFQELSEDSRLPSLKIKGGKAAEPNLHNDPFQSNGMARAMKELGLTQMDQVS